MRWARLVASWAMRSQAQLWSTTHVLHDSQRRGHSRSDRPCSAPLLPGTRSGRYPNASASVGKRCQRSAHGGLCHAAGAEAMWIRWRLSSSWAGPFAGQLLALTQRPCGPTHQASLGLLSVMCRRRPIPRARMSGIQSTPCSRAPASSQWIIEHNKDSTGLFSQTAPNNLKEMTLHGQSGEKTYMMTWTHTCWCSTALRPIHLT